MEPPKTLILFHNRMNNTYKKYFGATYCVLRMNLRALRVLTHVILTAITREISFPTL